MRSSSYPSAWHRVLGLSHLGPQVHQQLIERVQSNRSPTQPGYSRSMITKTSHAQDRTQSPACGPSCVSLTHVIPERTDQRKDEKHQVNGERQVHRGMDHDGTRAGRHEKSTPLGPGTSWARRRSAGARSPFAAGPWASAAFTGAVSGMARDRSRAGHRGVRKLVLDHRACLRCKQVEPGWRCRCYWLHRRSAPPKIEPCRHRRK